MKTNAMIGFFDVKEYKKGVELKDRKTKAEGEQIGFDTSFEPAQLPQELAKYVREYTTQDGKPRLAVKFKLSNKVRWFDSNAKPTAKPTNDELFGKCFRVVIDYTELNGNPNEKEACGYWANAIMFEEVSDNPFENSPLHATQEAVQPEQKQQVDIF